MATALMQLFQIQDTNMTNCHRSYSCCHLPRRLWWLHLHCSYVDATFFTPFCFSSPSSQLFLIQDSNCRKNSYFCCHLPRTRRLSISSYTHTYTYLHYNYKSEIGSIVSVSAFLVVTTAILVADILVIVAIATN